MWYHFTCTVDLIDHHVIFVMVFCFCTDSRYSFVSSKTIELINTCREIIIFPSTDSCSYLYIIWHLKTWMLCCVLLCPGRIHFIQLPRRSFITSNALNQALFNRSWTIAVIFLVRHMHIHTWNDFTISRFMLCVCACAECWEWICTHLGRVVLLKTVNGFCYSQIRKSH